jgi:hypothetical protein
MEQYRDPLKMTAEYVRCGGRGKPGKRSAKVKEEIWKHT